MILYNGTIYGSNLATLIENHIYRNINQQAEVKSCEYSVNERLLHKVCPTLEANYVVFIGEYAEAAQMLVDLALDNKDHIKFIAADGAFHKRFIQLAGLRSEGAYVIGYNTDLKNNSLAELEKQAKKFNADLSSFLVYSYDATKIILDGLDDFLNGDYSSLAEAISKPDHQVASGTISFDQYGDPKQNRFAIYKVEKQKFIKNML
jgi:ABC-type branched-subunit amino acid transport system substrate-binding protein